MANHESYPNEAPRGSEKVLLAVEVMRAMQDLLSDEHEPHPDTWYTTWQELHDEVSQFSDRDSIARSVLVTQKLMNYV